MTASPDSLPVPGPTPRPGTGSVPTPTTAGITAEDMKRLLGLDPADVVDDEWLAAVVEAVNAYVAGLPVIADATDPEYAWPADVRLGATMLAQHLYSSRSAPYGRASLDIAGGFQVAYADPEIARLLRLRRWARPMVR